MKAKPLFLLMSFVITVFIAGNSFANGHHPGNYTVIVEDYEYRPQPILIRAKDMYQAVELVYNQVAKQNGLPTRVYCPEGELVWDFTDPKGLIGVGK